MSTIICNAYTRYKNTLNHVAGIQV